MLPFAAALIVVEELRKRAVRRQGANLAARSR
jgi:hypothetical protein